MSNTKILPLVAFQIDPCSTILYWWCFLSWTFDKEFLYSSFITL